MPEITTLLQSLDELLQEAKLTNTYSGDWMRFRWLLQDAYPQLRAYIADAFRVAEAGRVLAEAVEKMGSDDVPGIAYDAHIPQDVMSEMSRDMENTMQGFNGANSMWREQRDRALTTYLAATQDLTSKEQGVCTKTENA